MANFDSKVKVNSQINAKSILLIEEDGTKLGSFAHYDALKLAQEKGLDLIEMSHNKATGESICKIADYGKFLYSKKKKEKEQDKHQRQSAIDLKEIQLRPTTDSHDLEIKAKKSLNFLDDGDRVKVILKLSGRQVTHKDVGKKKIDEFLSFVNAEDIEKSLYFEGNDMVVILFRKRK
jgi:translation initiation factor IF-3